MYTVNKNNNKNMNITCSVQETILNTIYTLRPYWDIFKHHPNTENKDEKTEWQLHMPAVTYLGPEEPATKPFPTRDCYPIQSEEFISNVQTKLNALISGMLQDKFLNTYNWNFFNGNI
jgi:hypothetical protein